MFNRAFADDVSGWNNPKAEVVDLLDSGFMEEKVTGMKKLKKFRAMRCHNKKLSFSKLPELEVIDLTLCTNLEELEIIKCPKLKVLELSFAMKLKKITGDFPSLEYLSCPSTSITELPKAKQLVYLNIDWCAELENIDINMFPKLMRFHFLSLNDDNFLMSKVSSHPSLVQFEVQKCLVTFDSFNPKSKLRYINLVKASVEGDVSCVPERVFIQMPDFSSRGELCRDPIKECDDVQMLLYGPWGIPPCDLVIPEPMPVVIKPPECSIRNASNAIAGAIFGSAVMDMVGLGVEFETRNTAQMRLLGRLNITWTHPWLNEHTGSFIRGTATDDTSQALLIMRSLTEANSPSGKHSSLLEKVGPANIDIGDFAERLYDWMNHGHVEHKDGKGLGMGRTTKAVLTSKDFVTKPKECARNVWEKHNKSIASNGAVMRTAPVGCFCFWDEEVVIKTATEYAATTHADPRCIFSSVCVSMLVSRIIRFLSGIESSFDVDITIADAMKVVDGIEPFKDEILRYSNAKTVQELELFHTDGSIGYTLKAYGAGIWALRHTGSFESALAQVIREGGDADTNGAVVGALMGATVGFSDIPDYLLKYMYNGQWLYNDMYKFMTMMGIEPPKSLWFDSK
jgi:ADP-ribosylglycohydrolase